MKITLYLFILAAAAAASAENNVPASVQIESGAASFEVSTNVPGVEVKGRSGSLTARLEIVRDSQRLVLQQIAGSLPVNSLLTGMKLRDEHMRKYIFTTPDAQLPDIHFAADRAVCPAPPGSSEFTCQIAGNLSIRAISRAFTMSLSVKVRPGAPMQFRATGNAFLKLSDYGIAQPSQLGVTTSNEVKLHLDFLAKGSNTGTNAAGGGQ